MSAQYIPNFCLLGERATARWQHVEDDAHGIPLSSSDGHTFDTGRPYAFRQIDIGAGLEPGEVTGGFYYDFITRVIAYSIRTSVYTGGGELPSLIVSPGQSDLYPASVTFNFKTSGNETWSGLTTMSNRSAYEAHPGTMPCNSPATPGADMDLTISGTSTLDYSPAAGPIICTFSFKILGSFLIGYPYNTGGGSYMAYELRMDWGWGPDDAGQFGGGGYTTIYPGAFPNLVFGTDILTASLVTNDPNFGSADDSSQSFFDAFVYNFASSHAPPYSQPTTQVDNGSFTGDFQIPVVPTDPDGGYFSYTDPVSGLPWFDRATGRLVTNAPMSIITPP